MIAPLRSRCLAIRIAAPKRDEIASILAKVAERERITLPPMLAARLVKDSKRNLRRALLNLEACKVRQYPFTENTVRACDFVPRPAARHSTPCCFYPSAFVCLVVYLLLIAVLCWCLQPVEIPDWEKFIADMAASILEQQTPQRFRSISGVETGVTICGSVIGQTQASARKSLRPPDALHSGLHYPQGLSGRKETHFAVDSCVRFADASARSQHKAGL